jgi:hypothetical protein
MYNLKDYIVVLKNIVPDELCDAVLAEYSASDEWGETAVGDGKPNKKVRNCDTIQMSQPFVIQDNKERARLDAELFKCAAKCIAEYNKKFEHSQNARRHRV